MQESGLVELEVRGIWSGESPPRPPSALLRPRARPGAPSLSLSLASSEAHLLAHELRGQPTVRSQALDFALRAIEALGAHPLSVHLIAAGPGLATASARVQMSTGCVDVALTPGLALALHAWLRLPLLAPGALVASDRPEAEPSLAPALARLIEALERGESCPDTPAGC